MLVHRRFEHKRIGSPDDRSARSGAEFQAPDAEPPYSEDMLDLVRRRSSPGVVVVGAADVILYTNDEADVLLLRSRGILHEIRMLCGRVRDSARLSHANSGICALFRGANDTLYSLRAFSIGRRQNDADGGHVMVLVERVVEQRAINLERAHEKYRLSEREVQVASLVTEGLSNKEIGARLFVCEYTIKDHLKKIMRKLNVSSRSAISSLLK